MITSTGNGRVKQLIQWQKKRKSRDEAGVFLVEGIRMYVEAPPDKVQAVYVSESFYQKKNNELCLNKWGNKLELLSDTVFAHVSDTKAAQGILLVMEQMEYTMEDMAGTDNTAVPLLIVLEHLQDPGNLGTILRAGEAAGVTGIIMSRDSVDIYNPKVIRSTMGAIYRMPFVYVDDLWDVVRNLQASGIHTYAAHLQGQNNYEEEDYCKGTAFLIGNEGNGLRKETAEAAQTYVKIPMCGQVESLNAAVASSVLMFEAARQRRLMYMERKGRRGKN